MSKTKDNTSIDIAVMNANLEAIRIGVVDLKTDLAAFKVDIRNNYVSKAEFEPIKSFRDQIINFILIGVMAAVAGAIVFTIRMGQ